MRRRTYRSRRTYPPLTVQADAHSVSLSTLLLFSALLWLGLVGAFLLWGSLAGSR